MLSAAGRDPLGSYVVRSGSGSDGIRCLLDAGRGPMESDAILCGLLLFWVGFGSFLDQFWCLWGSLGPPGAHPAKSIPIFVNLVSPGSHFELIFVSFWTCLGTFLRPKSQRKSDAKSKLIFSGFGVDFGAEKSSK